LCTSDGQRGLKIGRSKTVASHHGPFLSAPAIVVSCVEFLEYYSRSISYEIKLFENFRFYYIDLELFRDLLPEDLIFFDFE
jgi:hypothetical protein